jgi:pimeloyl-ACP methyl ester carboxylesterase
MSYIPRFSRRSLLLSAAAVAAVSPTAAISSSNRITVSRDGANLYVEVEGSGAPILLLHGGLGHMGWFEALRRDLVARGRQVVLLDTRGMGRSSMGRSLSYALQERDAHAVLDHVGIRRTDVIGFSDGGIVGYRMAARVDSRVLRLVTVGARWSAENGRSMWGTFDSWNRKTLSEGDFKFIVDDYDRLNPDRDFDRLMKAAVGMWKDSGDEGHPGSSIDRIMQPVLVAVGDRDPFLSVADAASGTQRIRNSQLLVLPKASHPAYRERADIFNPALDAFLATKV